MSRQLVLALISCLFCVQAAIGQTATKRFGTGATGHLKHNVRARPRTAGTREHLPESEYPILPPLDRNSEKTVEQISFNSDGAPALNMRSNHATSLPYQRCGSRQRALIWGKAEYLHWWTRGIEVPALATTSPRATPQSEAGVLGLPSTTILFGDAGLTNESRSGGRYTLGSWLDPWQCAGLEVIYTRLGDETESFSASDNDMAILTRPFFNTENIAEESHLIAFPDVVSGTLDIDLTTEFQTLAVLFRKRVSGNAMSGVDYVLGYRYAELNDGLRASENTLLLSPAAQGATIALFDQFDTFNEFHGGELGFVTRWQSLPCLSGELTAKVALGSTRSSVNVSGESTSTVGGASSTAPGGLLAQSTNIGSVEKRSFSSVAEFGFNVRRRFHPGWIASFGYTFMYWSEVARVGDQLDLGINTTQIPPGTLVGEARPQPKFDTTSFWAQGLSVGLEVAF